MIIESVVVGGGGELSAVADGRGTGVVPLDDDVMVD